MKIGYIGLGKMGLGMAERLKEKGYEVIAYNRSEEPRKEAEEKGIETTDSLESLISSLEAPRTIWLMVTHKAVDEVLSQIKPLLSEGDTVIDGGNSFYKDSMRRGQELETAGINFLDAGVSGGPKGARNGACIMVGGEKEIFEKYQKLFADLSVENGSAYMGKNGAGHFVKMVHNGIEYGMMQSIAEGFEIMKKSDFGLNLKNVSKLYNHGSVVESRLVNWLTEGFEKYGEDLEEIKGEVSHTGEGEWTVKAGEEFGVPTPAIKSAFDFRVQSKNNPSYTGKILSTLRNMFGGHDAK